MYLPLIGAVLAPSWVLDRIRNAPLRTVFGLAAAAALVTAGGAAYMRNLTWQDGQVLWTNAAEQAPHAAVPQRELGRLLLTQGDDAARRAIELSLREDRPGADAAMQNASDYYRTAEQHLRAATEAGDDAPATRVALGTTLKNLGELQAAQEVFLEVLRHDPANGECAAHLALTSELLAAKSMTPDARAQSLKYYRLADRLGGLTPELQLRYGMLLGSVGDLKQGLAVLRPLVSGEETGVLPQQIKEMENAAALLDQMEQRAMSLLIANPLDLEGLKLQAQSDMMAGRAFQAACIADGLLRKHPGDLGLWLLLGAARARMSQTEVFLRDWPEPPAGDAPWHQLALACAAQGSWDAALAYLEHASGAPGTSLSLTSLADVAIQLRQSARARTYLLRAAEQFPSDSLPWLKLCDLALAAHDDAAAQQALLEAEKRGAAPSEISARREPSGLPPPATGEQEVWRIVE